MLKGKKPEKEMEDSSSSDENQHGIFEDGPFAFKPYLDLKKKTEAVAKAKVLKEKAAAKALKSAAVKGNTGTLESRKQGMSIMEPLMRKEEEKKRKIQEPPKSKEDKKQRRGQQPQWDLLDIGEQRKKPLPVVFKAAEVPRKQKSTAPEVEEPVVIPSLQLSDKFAMERRVRRQALHNLAFQGSLGGASPNVAKSISPRSENMKFKASSNVSLAQFDSDDEFEKALEVMRKRQESGEQLRVKVESPAKFAAPPAK